MKKYFTKDLDHATTQVLSQTLAKLPEDSLVQVLVGNTMANSTTHKNYTIIFQADSNFDILTLD